MSQDLHLFEVRLARTLPQNALILAARSVRQVSHGRVIEGHRWDLLGRVVLNLEVKYFQGIKLGQVIEIGGRISLDLLQE